jgi:ABC-type amino acid transport substrate-binding protein
VVELLFNDINLYLKPGKEFPFESELERFKYLQNCFQAWEGEYGEIPFFQEQFKRCEEELNSWNTTLYNVLPLNYNQEIIETTLNLTFNKEPVINYQWDNELSKEHLINFLRYGQAINYTFIENNKIKQEAIDPRFYFPVFNELNVKEVKQHCVIFTISNKLYAKIHTPGILEERVYNYKDGRIGSLIELKETKTGLNEVAISIVKNATTSENVYGKSLFDKINIPLAQIFVGMTQINRVLDKSVDPMLIVPESAIDYDEYGQPYYKLKNALIMKSKEDPKPERITWDASLSAAFDNLNLWFKKLADVSGLGPIILDTEKEVLAGLSGEAMRRLNSKAISTVNGLRQKLDVLITQAINKELALKNKKQEIEISWEDLFMDSDSEKLDYVTKRLDNGTMSKVEAIMYMDDITEEEAKVKLNQINEEYNPDMTVMDDEI